MACRLFVPKPLSEPVLAYHCQSIEPTSTSWLSVQHFVQVNYKGIIKAMCYWPFCEGKPPMIRGFPHKGSIMLRASVIAPVCLTTLESGKCWLTSVLQLGAFPRWWPPSSTWAGPLLFYGRRHWGCLNDPIFSNFGYVLHDEHISSVIANCGQHLSIANPYL